LDILLLYLMTASFFIHMPVSRCRSC
jgi:hypothetical protein